MHNQLNTEADKNDEHHLLRMLDSFIHHSHLCLVFECLSSNLYELIKHNQFRGLSLQLVKMFTAQLLDALSVLKDHRLIHCDLKPENILLQRYATPLGDTNTITYYRNLLQLELATDQSH
jgi:dual specificity protein kinase YAK1